MTDTHRPALAYHLSPGTAPTVIFLPGYASDMAGTKAMALEAWAKRAGRAYLRFDYSGCGESEGAFAEQTLTGWRDDAIALIENLVTGPVVLVGSSMGGWIALLVAKLRPERVVGLIGVAPAPDFTDWGFTMDEKMALLQNGRIERASLYSDQPTLYTGAFWQSGEANRVMFGEIAFDGPVRFLQGQQDKDVPWVRTARLAELIRSANVQTVLIKDGDHRLSRDTDIALLIRAVEEVIACL